MHCGIQNGITQYIGVWLTTHRCIVIGYCNHCNFRKRE